jgi:hypothetical protein
MDTELLDAVSPLATEREQNGQVLSPMNASMELPSLGESSAGDGSSQESARSGVPLARSYSSAVRGLDDSFLTAFANVADSSFATEDDDDFNFGGADEGASKATIEAAPTRSVLSPKSPVLTGSGSAASTEGTEASSSNEQNVANTEAVSVQRPLPNRHKSSAAMTTPQKDSAQQYASPVSPPRRASDTTVRRGAAAGRGSAGSGVSPLSRAASTPPKRSSVTGLAVSFEDYMGGEGDSVRLDHTGGLLLGGTAGQQSASRRVKRDRDAVSCHCIRLLYFVVLCYWCAIASHVLHVVLFQQHESCSD